MLNLVPFTVAACLRVWCGGTQTMELEYGRPVEEIFVDITPEPLAAASLGQVPTSFLAALAFLLIGNFEAMGLNHVTQSHSAIVAGENRVKVALGCGLDVPSPLLLFRS